MDPRLNQLLQQHNVWTGRHWQQELPAEATGYAQLDECLPGMGLPKGAITEIFYRQDGIGELRLLVPMLARLSQQKRWIIFIAPPHVPYAPALAAAGVDLSRVLVIHPSKVKDELWTLEQALKSGNCSAVLAWPRAINDVQLRRLQLAAQKGDTLGIFFHRRGRPQSPAALRLRLEARNKVVELAVEKRRGGWPLPAQPLDLGDEHIVGAKVLRGPWEH
ncbi:translesion DNA synthesis-associated protein ImuA [Gallaecimonas kandeliae]|uniref:translesion DNA synthesis-associated protein ImuA n=1 Tax=Gallaecimonas kandeliae TaxID=3029055 RepID=UPI002647EDAE|nr:translesion DNA synthesis-associated protein ImuA [Gallaecimonas kandeliae]WKE66804.1 translesion DNA synthesis-associated protein ImuA [Gallaecimonas kandeliae]